MPQRTSSIIILFYFCFITVFFSHLTWAQTKSTTFNAEDNSKALETDSLKVGNSTSYPDASNEAPELKLWQRYWGFLLAAIILFIILTVMFILARIKNKDGRNFLAIFLCELLQIDLALDIAFIVLHGRDFKWILPASLFFLLFPIFLNIIFTILIIKEEKEKSKSKLQFNKWWKKHRITANAFKAASCLDTDALQIVSSRAGGIEELSAPISEEGEKSIMYKTGFVALLEDLPQLIIYVIYLRFHIKWAIVPILVTISCIIVLMLKLSALLCFTRCFRLPKDEEDPYKENVGGDSSSSSSSEKEDYRAPTPFSPDSTRGPQDAPKDGNVGEDGKKIGETKTIGNLV